MMSDRQFKRWEKLRRGGRWRYILVQGVIVWGGVTAIAAAAIGSFLGGRRDFSDQLVINLVTFPVGGGLFFGPFTWVVNERQYGRRQRARDRSRSPCTPDGQ